MMGIAAAETGESHLESPESYTQKQILQFQTTILELYTVRLEDCSRIPNGIPSHQRAAGNPTPTRIPLVYCSTTENPIFYRQSQQQQQAERHSNQQQKHHAATNKKKLGNSESQNPTVQQNPRIPIPPLESQWNPRILLQNPRIA